MKRSYLVGIIVLSFLINPSVNYSQTNNEIFQKIVDDKVELDTLIIQQLLNKEGEKKLFFALFV